MANTFKSESNLKAVMTFADSDTRTISVPNPQNFTDEDETEVRGYLNGFGAILIGDKTGSAFASVKTAYIEEVNTTTLDLSS